MKVTPETGSLWADETTAGREVKPTFTDAVTDRLLYGATVVHYYAVRKDGALHCLGCRRPIIQTPYGEPCRVLGAPLQWFERACGGSGETGEW